MVHSLATKINFDEGIINTLNVNTFKNILVLTGTQYSLETFEKKIKPLIKKNCHVYANISGNLTDELIYSAVNFASDKKIDCIISVGADNVMDCGRLVSLLLSHGGQLHDYFLGGSKGPLGITPKTIHHITVPIMPAAGYEIASYASFKSGNSKFILESPYLIPMETFIDPLIMQGLPPDLWPIILFDCFATAMSAYVSAYANPTSDAFAEQALSSYINHSKLLLKDPNNLEHIKHAATASINAFLAANFSSRGAMHAISDVLFAKLNLRYGSALACVCAEVSAFFYDSNKARYDKIATMIGGKGGTAASVKSSISKMIKESGLYVPSFTGKLSTEELEQFALESMSSGAMRGNTKQMTAKDVYGVLRRLP